MADDDLEFDSDDETIPSRRMTALDILIHLVVWINGLLSVTAAVTDNVRREMCAHYNWQVDQRQFAEAARQDIEAITEVADAQQ